MGQVLTKVKITLDRAGRIDKHYNKLTIAFDGTKQDLKDTIAIFLNNQREEGLLTDEDFEDLRNARIEDDTEDKDGIFGDFVSDVKDIF